MYVWQWWKKGWHTDYVCVGWEEIIDVLGIYGYVRMTVVERIDTQIVFACVGWEEIIDVLGIYGYVRMTVVERIDTQIVFV